MFNQFVRVREAKNTFLRDEGRCNTCPSFIDHNNFVTNRPHECNFFVGACHISHLVSKNLVFCRYPNHAGDPINDRVTTKFHDIVKKAKTLNQ